MKRESIQQHRTILISFIFVLFSFTLPSLPVPTTRLIGIRCALVISFLASSMFGSSSHYFYALSIRQQNKWNIRKYVFSCKFEHITTENTKRVRGKLLLSTFVTYFHQFFYLLPIFIHYHPFSFNQTWMKIGKSGWK